MEKMETQDKEVTRSSRSHGLSAELTFFLGGTEGFPGSTVGKEHTCQCRRNERRGSDPLEEEMAPHSSILTWRIPWTEEPGGLQSMGLHNVRHD